MLIYCILSVIGIFVGWFISRWVDYLTPVPESTSTKLILQFRIRVMFVTGLLFALLPYAIIEQGSQQALPEVQQNEFWWWGRVVFQLMLITLLVAATATDLREYIIHDATILPGILIAFVAATASGHLQMMHLWIDWSQQIEGLRGPYIPQWIAENQHWHGLAVTVAGGVMGAGVTWLVRVTSSLILGKESLGLGDVTLMAMIGSFLGWQPVMFVFLFAPACGIIMGAIVWLGSRKNYIPFGPSLCAGAIVVLFSWHWLWRETRLVFGHPPSLLMLAGVAWGALVLMLVALRIYQRKAALQ